MLQRSHRVTSHTRDFLLGVGGEGCAVVTCERRPVSGERARAGGDDGLYGLGCGACAVVTGNVSCCPLVSLVLGAWFWNVGGS